MITKVEKIAFIALGIIVVLGFVFWKDAKTLMTKRTAATQVESKKEKKKHKENKGDVKEKTVATQGININKKWELPSSLKEISGIATMDHSRIACVQDESGTIYAFN